MNAVTSKASEYSEVYNAMTNGGTASDSECSAAAHSVDWQVAYDYLVSKLGRKPTDSEVNRVLDRM